MNHVTKRIALISALALFAPLAAHADEVVPVGHFNAVELAGGGHVTLRHGDHQQVRILEGSTQYSEVLVKPDGTLRIQACGKEGVMNMIFSCPWHYNLEVEITTPDISGASVHGGGHMEAGDGFPANQRFSAEVHGGGHLDVRAIQAGDANAEVHGGGKIEMTAKNHLNAEVHGGGHIEYWGHPAVQSEIHGGGEVSRADG